MIYKNIGSFFESFIRREVADASDKEMLEGKIIEVVTYFKLLYINSGQGAFYNILSSYISDETGLYELLRKCYERLKAGRLNDEESSSDLIIKSIFSNNFLKKFDKEAKVSIPPIVAIFYSGFYEEEETSWLIKSKNATIDVDIENYEDILKTAKEKELEEIGIELIEDLVEIREKDLGDNREKLKSAYILLADGHSRYNNTKDEIKNHEKIIEICEAQNQIDSEDMIRASNRIGSILQVQGKIVNSIVYFEKALKSMIALYGFKDIKIGKQNELIATTLLLHGDTRKACKVFTIVGSNYEINLGIENPTTLQVYNTIADLQIETQDYKNAYKSFMKTYEHVIKKFGVSSEHAIMTKAKLSVVCKEIGKFEEMDTLHVECLQTIYNDFEDLHEVKGIVIQTKAEVERDNGNYTEALDLFEQALDIYMDTVGKTDEKTISIHSSIGLMYEKLNLLDSALGNFEKEYVLRKSINKEENIKIINLKEKMGNVLRLQGKYQNALSYLNEALEFKRDMYPEEHFEMLTLYTNLGKLYKDTSNYVESYEFLEKALVIAKLSLNELDEMLIDIYENIAVLKGYNGEVDLAYEYYNIVVERLSQLGHNQEVAKIYKALAELFLSVENYEKATEYAMKSKVATELAVGKDDILNLDCVNLLAHVYNEAGNCEQAILAYQDVCRIVIQKFGKLNHNLAIAYENMSGVFLKLEKLDEAIQFLNLSLNINISNFGEFSPQVSNNYSNIAFIEYLQKKNSEALMHYEKVLQINEKTNMVDASVTSEIFYALGRLYSGLNDYPKALKYYKSSMMLMETVKNDLEVVIEENFLIEQCYKFEEEKKYSESVNVFQKYLSERSKKQGVTAIGKGVIYQKIAECYKNIPGSDVLLQILYLNKSLLVKTKIHGVNNPIMANDFLEFAIANRERGDRAVALEYFIKALDIFEVLDNKENALKVAELKLNIGILLREKQSFTEAIAKITDALNYFESTGSDNLLVWKAITELGNTYLEADETEAALEYYEKSEEFCKNDNYRYKGCAGITFYNLGDTYRILNRKRDAVMYYERALTIEKDVNGEETFIAGALETNIGLIYKSAGDSKKAEEYFLRAKKAYKESVGVEHNNYQYINILLEEVRLQLLYNEDKEEKGISKILNIVKGY